MAGLLLMAAREETWTFAPTGVYEFAQFSLQIQGSVGVFDKYDADRGV
jgi:hypothetical protein